MHIFVGTTELQSDINSPETLLTRLPCSFQRLSIQKLFKICYDKTDFTPFIFFKLLNVRVPFYDQIQLNYSCTIMKKSELTLYPMCRSKLLLSPLLGSCHIDRKICTEIPEY